MLLSIINIFNKNKEDLLNLNDLLKDEDDSIKKMAEEEIKGKK